MSCRNKAKRALLSLFLVLTLTLVFSSGSMAEKKGGRAFVDASFAVDVIVNIDPDTRVITLKNEAGEHYNFTAGPEVKNFAQLKRGDLVLTEYYAGFAIALKPKGSDLGAKDSMMKIETAAPGEKPGVKVTSGIFVAAQVVGIDQEQRVVVLEGPEHVLALKVSDQVNIADLEVGQEVDAVYAESYAISVQPAPKVSGTVDVKATTVAVGIGISWGEGTLTMYDGSKHEFTVKGMTAVDVGATSVEATGTVYNLVEAKDLEGLFVGGAAGAAMVGGGSVLTLQNENGVLVKLRSTQKGLRLSLAGQGMKVKLK